LEFRLYLKFEKERTRAARDLLAQPEFEPDTRRRYIPPIGLTSMTSMVDCGICR
jgi:trans-aconitate methyltransferase